MGYLDAEARGIGGNKTHRGAKNRLSPQLVPQKMSGWERTNSDERKSPQAEIRWNYRGLVRLIGRRWMKLDVDKRKAGAG